MNQLITSIELLSNQKSFRLGIGNTSENLWFLMHFKKLEILNTVIYHQQYSEFRTAKTTKYPTSFITFKLFFVREILKLFCSSTRSQ
jgi:hypothetical protein